MPVVTSLRAHTITAKLINQFQGTRVTKPSTKKLFSLGSGDYSSPQFAQLVNASVTTNTLDELSYFYFRECYADTIGT